ncbi:MAG: hypothetical protein ACOC29_03320 [Candidatus Sumerlaeota bacterium]
MDSIWNKQFAIQPDKWNRLVLGPLTLWVARRHDEWRIVARRDEEKPVDGMSSEERAPAFFETDVESPPPELETRRWIMRSDCSDHLRFMPAMGDRSVVVRPSEPIVLAPRAKGMFYVSIPLWVGIQVGEKSPREILRQPTVELSNIWLGTRDAGELSYSLRSHARRNFETFPDLPYRCICPVRLHNTSEEDLHFERISLRVSHLAIYEGAQSLWANEVSYSAKGDEALSKIEYGQQPPASAEQKMTRLREADSPRKTSMLMRGLANLRSRM